jgi:hypothetical protein
LIISNIFGQYQYGREKCHTEYKSLSGGMRHILKVATDEQKIVYIPYKIGCGLAGGNWNIVEKMIYEVFDNTNVTCFICKYE